MTNYRRNQARIRRIEARYSITNRLNPKPLIYRLMPRSGRDAEDKGRALYVRET